MVGGADAPVLAGEASAAPALEVDAVKLPAQLPPEPPSLSDRALAAIALSASLSWLVLAVLLWRHAGPLGLLAVSVVGAYTVVALFFFWRWVRRRHPLSLQLVFLPAGWALAALREAGAISPILSRAALLTGALLGVLLGLTALSSFLTTIRHDRWRAGG